MKHHRITYFTTTSAVYASCSCRGWSSAHYPTRQAVEDEAFRHIRNVEKARAAQRSSSPSMSRMRDYYRRQVDDPNTPPHDRAIWAQMADELDQRLGAAHIGEDVPLPFE